MSNLFLLTILPLSKLSGLKELPRILHVLTDMQKKWNISNGWVIAIVIIAAIVFFMGGDSDEKKKK